MENIGGLKPVEGETTLPDRLLLVAATVMRALVPMFILKLSDDTPSAIIAAWVISAAFLMHIPGFLSEFWSESMPDNVWKHLWACYIVLGALFGVMTHCYVYTVTQASAFEALTWMTAVPCGILALLWARRAYASPLSPYSDNSPDEDSTPATSSPAISMALFSAFVFALAFITLGNTDTLNSNLIGAVFAISAVLFVEFTRGITVRNRIPLLTVMFPSLLVALAGTAILLAIVDIPNSDGFGFNKTDSLGFFGWFTNAARLGYNAGAAAGLAVFGLSFYGNSVILSRPSQLLVRGLVFFEPFIGAGAAALTRDQHLPEAVTWVAGLTVVALAQLVYHFTASSWKHFVPTPYWAGSDPNAGEHQGSPQPEPWLGELLLSFTCASSNLPNRSRKSLVKVMKQKTVPAGRSVRFQISGDEVKPSAGSSTFSAKLPPRVGTMSDVDPLSLRHLDTEVLPPGPPVIASLDPENLPVPAQIRIKNILIKHGIETQEQLEAADLPAPVAAIARHFLPAETDGPLPPARRRRSSTASSASVPVPDDHKVITAPRPPPPTSSKAAIERGFGPSAEAKEMMSRVRRPHNRRGSEESVVDDEEETSSDELDQAPPPRRRRSLTDAMVSEEAAAAAAAAASTEGDRPPPPRRRRSLTDAMLSADMAAAAAAGPIADGQKPQRPRRRRRSSASSGLQQDAAAAIEAAAADAIPESPDETEGSAEKLTRRLEDLDKDELAKVLRLLDFYDIRCREDMENADMPEEVKEYLINLVPLSVIPTAANVARRNTAKAPLQRSRSRRPSVSSIGSRTSIGSSGSVEKPRPASRSQSGKLKLKPLASKSRRPSIPGAIVTPTPVAISEGFTFEPVPLPGRSKKSQANAKMYMAPSSGPTADGGITIRAHAGASRDDDDEDSCDDPWNSPERTANPVTETGRRSVASVASNGQGSSSYASV